MIPDVEWSGILLYETKNREDRPSEWISTALDFFPMDKGVKTHTQFEFTSEFVDYADNNNIDLEKCQFGLIHSHNTMGVFFSAEDLSELEDNTKHFDAYLSVIVNNNGDICAKISHVAEVEYTIKNHLKEFITIKSGKKVFSYDCNIVYEDSLNKDWLTQAEIVKSIVPKVNIFQNKLLPTTSTPKGWQNPSVKQPTLFDTPKLIFEEFVCQEVFGCYDDIPLSIACQNYDDYFDTEMFIAAYDEYFGKTSLVEEKAMLVKLTSLIEELIPHNKNLKSIIQDIKEYTTVNYVR